MSQYSRTCLGERLTADDTRSSRTISNVAPGSMPGVCVKDTASFTQSDPVLRGNRSTQDPFPSSNENLSRLVPTSTATMLENRLHISMV